MTFDNKSLLQTRLQWLKVTYNLIKKSKMAETRKHMAFEYNLTIKINCLSVGFSLNFLVPLIIYITRLTVVMQIETVNILEWEFESSENVTEKLTKRVARQRSLNIFFSNFSETSLKYSPKSKELQNFEISHTNEKKYKKTI